MYYAQIDGKTYGPFETDKLKRLAAAGKISRGDKISKDRQTWVPAGNVKGLLPPELSVPARLPPVEAPAVVAEVLPAIESSPLSESGPLVVVGDVARQAGTIAISAVMVASRAAGSTVKLLTPKRVEVPAPPIQPPTPATQTNKDCPFCGEQVLAVAKKCKHCGEILDVTLRASAPQVVQGPTPSISITNVNTAIANGGMRKRWSRLVAFVLSLIIPGLGQLYKGQLLNGFVWFLVVGAGYLFLIVPGIALHLCCALGAALGDPYR